MALRPGTDGTIAAVFPAIEPAPLRLQVAPEDPRRARPLTTDLNGGIRAALRGLARRRDYAERQPMLSIRITVAA